MPRLLNSFEAASKTMGAVMHQQRKHQPKNQAQDAFGIPSSGTRTSGADFSIRDVRDAKPVSRREMVKTSRLLRSKLGLVRGIFENSSRYALGPQGLIASSMSGNLEWSKRANDRFEEVTSRVEFDVREEQNFAGMQDIILPDVLCDGDVGAAMVRGGFDDEFGHPEMDEPQIQLFQTDQITNSITSLGLVGENAAAPNGAVWRDGILRAIRGGRPLKYRVKHDTLPGVPSSAGYTDYEKHEFLHIGKWNRINTNRPLPWLHHGDESALDILDLTALEKASARLNAYFAACIKTASGKLPPGFENILTNETDSVSTTNEDGETETKEITRSFVNFLGGAAIPVLGEGEEMQFFKNERRSETFSGFIDWLVNDIALGFGVPAQFVWALAGMTGPNARLVLQQADWFFAYLREMMITRFCRPVWEGVIADSMNRGYLDLPPDGANWRRVHFQGPASMTIDKGRDGKLFESLVKAGLMSRSEWHEMSGKSGREQRRKIIEEIAEDIAYCEEKGVPLELYFSVNPVEEFPDAVGQNGQVDPENLAETIVNLLQERRFEAGRKAA